MKKFVPTMVLAVAMLGAVPSAQAADTAAQYRTKVNAICKTGLAKLNAIPAPESADQIADFANKAAVAGKDLIKKITAVKPPAALQAQVTKAVQPQRESLDMLLKLRDAIRKGADPEATINSMDAKMTALTNKADAAWKAAGLASCSG